MQPDIMITENFVSRIRQLQAERGNPALMLRLAVDGGGCQGFEYRFDFSDDMAADDKVFEKDGVKLVIDATSLPLLAGSTVDFINELAGSAFRVINPNATSTCGCGTSFSA